MIEGTTLPGNPRPEEPRKGKNSHADELIRAGNSNICELKPAQEGSWAGATSLHPPTKEEQEGEANQFHIVGRNRRDGNDHAKALVVDCSLDKQPQTQEMKQPAAIE